MGAAATDPQKNCQMMKMIKENRQVLEQQVSACSETNVIAALSKILNTVRCGYRATKKTSFAVTNKRFTCFKKYSLCGKCLKLTKTIETFRLKQFNMNRTYIKDGKCEEYPLRAPKMDEEI